MNYLKSGKRKSQKKSKNSLQKLFQKYSRNFHKEGFQIVELMVNQNGDMTVVIGFPKKGTELIKGRKFNLDNYEERTMSLKYSITDIDTKERILTTRVEMVEDESTQHMKDELWKDKPNMEYMGWIQDFMDKIGDSILNVFDDYSIHCLDYTGIKVNRLLTQFLEPKNKEGHRMFPLEYN